MGGPRGGFFSPYINPNLKSGPNGESLTLRLGQETADFIEDHKDEPFLAYLSFYTVHAPIQTTHTLWKKYRAKAEKMDLIQKKERFLFDRRLNVRQVQDCPIYAGMIEQLDQSIGQWRSLLRGCLCHLQPASSWWQRQAVGRRDS